MDALAEAAPLLPLNVQVVALFARSGFGVSTGVAGAAKTDSAPPRMATRVRDGKWTIVTKRVMSGLNETLRFLCSRPARSTSDDDSKKDNLTEE